MVLTQTSMVKELKASKMIIRMNLGEKTLAEVEEGVNPQADSQEPRKVKVEATPGPQAKGETITPHPPGKPKLLGLRTLPAHPRITPGPPKEVARDLLRTDARTTQMKLLLVNSVCASWEVTQTACPSCYKSNHIAVLNTMQSFKDLRPFSQRVVSGFACPSMRSDGSLCKATEGTFGAGDCVGCLAYRRWAVRYYGSVQTGHNPTANVLLLGYERAMLDFLMRTQKCTSKSSRSTLIS